MSISLAELRIGGQVQRRIRIDRQEIAERRHQSAQRRRGAEVGVEGEQLGAVELGVALADALDR